MKLISVEQHDLYTVLLEVNGDELEQLGQGKAPLRSTQEQPSAPDGYDEIDGRPIYHRPSVASERPYTDLDRRALFALWADVFPDDSDVIRHDYTCQILGEHVSWDDLTYDQYRTLRDALIGVRVARDYLT
jgi:hypothetical protein